VTREKIDTRRAPNAYHVTLTMSLYKRGTKVQFVGKPPGRPDQDSSAKHYVDKYGVQVGDSGTVVCVKNGWWRVSFTRQDGSRAVSVPMRYDDIKKRKQDDDVEDVDDELVKRLKHLTTEDTLNAEQVQPPMNENFGFDEQPTPDAVVADMKKEAEKVRNRDAKIITGFGPPPARSLLEILDGVHSNWCAKEAKLKTELEEVKLQLISARTLMQLKDKTIAQLRGEPTYESWGDWVVA